MDTSIQKSVFNVGKNRETLWHLGHSLPSPLRVIETLLPMCTAKKIGVPFFCSSQCGAMVHPKKGRLLAFLILCQSQLTEALIPDKQSRPRRLGLSSHTQPLLVKKKRSLGTAGQYYCRNWNPHTQLVGF